MKNRDFEQFMEKLMEFNVEAVRFNEALASIIPEGDDETLPANAPAGETEKSNTVAVYVTKEASSEITDKEIEALKRCARAKGLTVRTIDENDEENQS